MQSMRTSRAEYPIVSPGALKSLSSCVPPTSVANKDAWSAERPPQAVQRIAGTIIPVPGWCGGLGYHEFF